MKPETYKKKIADLSSKLGDAKIQLEAATDLFSKYRQESEAKELEIDRLKNTIQFLKVNKEEDEIDYKESIDNENEHSEAYELSMVLMTKEIIKLKDMIKNLSRHNREYARMDQDRFKNQMTKNLKGTPMEFEYKDEKWTKSKS